jgi:hypothetical protein
MLKAGQCANAMFAESINVQPIFYPAFEEKAARSRFFICSRREPEQISARSSRTGASLANDTATNQTRGSLSCMP